MIINGIETLVYRVEDVSTCTRFFEDFGLVPVRSESDWSSFELPEGSKVEIRPLEGAGDTASRVRGAGVHEVIWGVPTVSDLEGFAADLGRDRELRHDADGTVHFLTDFGLAMGLRIFPKKQLISHPDEVNAPGHTRRINRSRKWYKRAKPKTLQHVVFGVPDAEAARNFMCSRLRFRLSDLVRPADVGARSERHNRVAFMRANGTHQHHTFAVLDGARDSHDPEQTVTFHHANFGVDDIDELMVGVNYMLQKGWEPSRVGLGRHRIASSLFYYFPSPTGGEAEYGADHDFLDDSWVPRVWPEPVFAGFIFAHNLPPFLREPPPWKVEYMNEEERGRI